MKFWVDAQLPPAVVGWLAQRFAVEATALRDMGLRDATDEAIFEAARSATAVIISKDSDFVDMVSRYGPPRQLLWVTCGTVTNRHLTQMFDRSFDEARTLLAGNQAIVELRR